MTLQEQELFRKEFKTIVWIKSEIVSSNIRLRNLHAWDKSGSHNKAILKELDVKNGLQNKLKELLKGNDYEQWLSTSKKLTKITRQLKTAELKVIEYTELLQKL